MCVITLISAVSGINAFFMFAVIILRGFLGGNSGGNLPRKMETIFINYFIYIKK